jgi:hypothetical protein
MIGESSNFELMDLCKKLKIPLNGVYCKDELDDLKKKNGCFIVNMMDEKDALKPNSVGHWIAFYKNPKYSVYFDSFGCVPPNDVIEYIYNDKLKNVYYNHQQIQHITDDYCGYICVMFLYWITKTNKFQSVENKLQSFINIFNYKNIKKNKEIVKKFFESTK